MKNKRNNIVEFKNITKTFLNGAIVANDDVSFSIEKGTIHAIAGENGAGKSTLLSMLFGLYKPTKGEIIVKDKKINYKSAADAMNDGLGMVQQHFQLVNKFTIGQNILLGNEPTKNGFLSTKKSFAKIDETAKKYGFGIKSTQKISSLTVGQEQKVEILKLLYRDSEILIFDEPTAMLTPKEIEELIETILKLKKQGKTIIIITHKLDEIKAMADEVTVIRKGKYVGTIDSKDLTPKKLSKMMVGTDLKANVKVAGKFGDVKLEVKNLSVTKKRIQKLKDISFAVRQGEILAIAGVEGNGQSELAESISGLAKNKTGQILLEGKDITKQSIGFRNKFGLAHIPEDRHKYGMILDMNTSENLMLKQMFDMPYTNKGFINNAEINKGANEIISNYDVRGADGGFAIARGLSGGNQQKAVVGRELSASANVLLIFQATRGLDVGAINYIHAQILKAREAGKAILLISYDLNEIIKLADRVLVFNSGSITGELKGKNITKDKIGVLMSKKGTVNE